MYGYEWTDEYGIFRLTIDAKLQKEIRPVFHEELDFFGMDAFWDYPKDTDAPLLWAEGVRRYVMNGVCVAEAQGGGFYTKPVIRRLTEERFRLRPIDVQRLYEINKPLMVSLEQKAIHFIREQYEEYRPKGYLFVCAFSGGKDSLALLDLCAKALSPDEFYVVFSNTGMELSDTLKAVEMAKEHWPELRFEEAKCHMEPNETWEEFGPPARRLRWCCSVHKSIPTVLKLRELTNSYNIRAIIFDGVRAEESVKRATYDEVVFGAKSVSQINCHAILRWNAAELFVYILSNGILLNNAYKTGLSRVGCMVCPMSSYWSEGIVHSAYPDDVRLLTSKVEDFAVRSKTEKESKRYIEEGGWKARVGGRGLKNGGERVIETVDNNSVTYTISNWKQPWLSVAPILGAIVEENSGKFTQIINGKKFEFLLSKRDNNIVVSYYPYSSMNRITITLLRGVASKTAFCIGCKNCMVKCPTGAFVIQSNNTVLIREDLCIHCAKCIEEMDKGCLVADSLKIQHGGAINMTNLDPYRGFGFRQDWLAHFIEYGVDCFSKNTLGTVQYNSLRSQLRDSKLIKAEKVDGANQFVLTPLGERIIAYGAYNPFSWAVIWANMVNNVTVFRWYCLNVEQGEAVEKQDLVVRLGEISSKRNRENAVNSLLSTFRDSPIGSVLKQGIMIDKAYLRAGWDYPHAVALLYSLYLYAERTGRRSFTFSELVNSHNDPDSPGVSPHDIFGIDAKTFREHVQGLAINYPKYIRVSFVANLDNIVLEDFSSLDILDLAED